MDGEVARCSLCGEPADPENFIVLEDAGENVWVIVSEGLKPGEAVVGNLLVVHPECLIEKGRKLGQLPPQG